MRKLSHYVFLTIVYSVLSEYVMLEIVTFSYTYS